MTAKIIGLIKLQRKFDRLPRVVQSRMQVAIAKQATGIVKMMQHIAPVSLDGSHGNPPGTLRGSVGWVWGKAPKGRSVMAYVSRSLGADLTATIFAGNEVAFYARWQEFGTVKTAAQPYFYPSWRASKRGAKRALRAAMRAATREVANS